jgi:hypothetical protein
MAERTKGKLNQLEHLLPEGRIVDSAWLNARGYSSSLRTQYVQGGWLAQPARQVYSRNGKSLSWQQVVVSLQEVLDLDLVVGGRTALELQGFAHYLPQETKEVHLYGPHRPPTWLNKLSVGVRFVWHNSELLFRRRTTHEKSEGHESLHAVTQPWGQWEWPLRISSPEQAVLELLNELPDHETFQEVDKLFEGLVNLSPQRLEKLLRDCHSVKVKRLFFFFAERHQPAWLKHVHKDSVDLGKGKRMLVRGGRLNRANLITVPEDLDAVP